MMGPKELSYLGDSVYETAVRTYLVKNGEHSLKDYNKLALKIVCAKAQCEAARYIETLLDEEEADIMRRGRNSKSGNVPKSATTEEYRTATGLETLFGYLHINENYDRISFLIEKIIKFLYNKEVES